MISMLKDVGVTSNHMYTAGFASIGVTLVKWGMSAMKPRDSRAQADRWGLFVGEWAPTFFAIGIALRLEEQGGLPHRERD
ncbi:hypothetical protein [Brachybacterium paraconglomeratum]|uniref:hypothetical protein n=1 Tax=Brachybacterium paraconglomeratum TaxID=173362 RepID=UPI0021A35729|nr:hypothetical protein [Brachybacterium paraconglomeratum]MCT1910019.1 hypothetical protein [Brachybacterium paraconglomeratum]